MSQYYGDIQLGDTIQWTFTTVDSAGAPTILTGSPTATAYTDGGVTQSATGVTLTANFDGVTGLNLMSVVATSGNGFAAGENIEIVLDAGTVDGGTVIGYAVGSFSVENRSNLRPTTVGNNEVDVTATGEVGLDFGNTTGTLDAAQFGGDFLTSAKIADGAFVAANFAASSLDGKGNWNIGKTGYALTTADWNVGKTGYSLTVTTGLGAQTANITGNLSGSVGSVSGAVGSVAGNVDGSVATATALGAGAVDNTSVGTLDNTNFAFVDGNERVDVGAWLGTAATSGTGGPDVNANAIGDSTSAAAQLALSAVEIENGAAEGTPSTTVIQTDLAEAQNDIYIGRIVIFSSGNARGEATEITDYDGSTGTLTVTALANAPAAADTFILL